MDLATFIILFIVAVVLVLLFSFAHWLDRRSRGTTNEGGLGAMWYRPLAYVGIIFGVLFMLVQAAKAGGASAAWGLIPLVSGIVWLVILSRDRLH